MGYYLNIDGGLGDIFCKMLYPDFSKHPIQHVSSLLRKHPKSSIVLSIYSDNIGSAELFRYSCFDKVNIYKYDQYPGEVSNIPIETEIYHDTMIGLSHDEWKVYKQICQEKVCIFHPFTSTPYKIMPDTINKKQFIDIMIDKYKYTVVLLNQDTQVYFGRKDPFIMKEEFTYQRNGLVRLLDFTDNISRLGFYITAHYASKIIAVNSAYIMLRNTFLNAEQQNTLALLWEDRSVFNNPNHSQYYYVRGLNEGRNMYIYYNDITDVEKLVDEFMKR